MFEAHLLNVFSVQATAETDVLLFDIETVDGFGVVSRSLFCSRPDDPYGFGPVIRTYLADNLAEIEIIPYQPPSAPE